MKFSGFAITFRRNRPMYASSQWCSTLARFLLSLDGDFADIVAYPPGLFKGIIALQVLDHPEVIPTLMDRLNNYLSTYPEMDHYVGKLIVVEAHRIRVRS